MGIIGLILAVALLVVGAYKGMGALLLALLATAVVIVFNGLSFVEGLTQTFMQGFTGAFMNFFLLFAVSALYAHVMDKSGSATAIGYKLIDWFGRKRVMLVSLLIVAILTYGGVSLFVVVFAVAPILFLLFREANLPRHLVVAPLVAGASTFTMVALPGSPALTNVIPTAFLGTTLTAAPIMGLIASLLIFAGVMAYMMWAEKRARARGEEWDEGGNLAAIQERSTLPNPIIAFIPILVVLAIIIIGGQFFANATLLTIIAMLIGTALVLLLNWNRFRGENIVKILGSGLDGGISAIAPFAAILGFGAVVASTPAFQSIIQWLIGLNINPYAKGVLATAAVAGVTGSSSAGLNIMYANLAEYFIASGANLDALHRLTAIAASSLDTLPHAGGLFLMFAVLGLSHKNAYRHVFFNTVVVTSIVTIIMLIATILLFPVGA